ncbi:hypothetical protein B566_EDAN009351 [Ephemera danica]|nr:hypothetical protein B566_EDAN009351 [Ephemera danica]
MFKIRAVALVAGQSNQYLPPKDAPPPRQDKNYLPPEEAPSQPDNQYLPSLEGEANQGVPSVRFPDQEKQEPHHEDHDHHHEHWDLRESIPGEPGQDYPLHHAPPDTGFSCHNVRQLILQKLFAGWPPRDGDKRQTDVIYD